jgi:hypothetical protein
MGLHDRNLSFKILLSMILYYYISGPEIYLDSKPCIDHLGMISWLKITCQFATVNMGDMGKNVCLMSMYMCNLQELAEQVTRQQTLHEKSEICQYSYQ